MRPMGKKAGLVDVAWASEAGEAEGREFLAGGVFKMRSLVTGVLSLAGVSIRGG